MALVVEDGTGIDGANTYAALATIRAYATDRGVTLSTDDAILTPFVYKAMDFLEGRELGLLSLTWPSTYGDVNGVPDADAIVRLSSAVSQLCIEQHNGVDLTPTRTTAFIVEEKVGPLSTKYSEQSGGGAGSNPDMPAVDAILRPLLTTSLGSAFRTLRA